MADFCKQCSIDLFGKDTKDLAGLTKEADKARGKYAVTICEGCGYTQVDVDGSCITDCLKHHADIDDEEP